MTGRRQLRWIAWGTALGVGPFAFGYALPWALGIDPPLALQLTAIPLGLVPLTFASAIVRYRLRDVEVIIKRGLAYTAFLGASVALYAALLKLTGFVFAADADRHNWIIALLATLVVVLLAQPVKDAMQNALDRVFYRDRYDYRRALVAFARDLNSDLDVVRLSQRLVARIVETLVVDRMALMLAPGDSDQAGDFVVDRRLRLHAAGAAPVAGLVDDGAARRRPHRSRSTIRLPARGSPPRKSSSGATPASTTSCRASSKGARSRSWRSAGRKPTSRSTARISAC